MRVMVIVKASANSEAGKMPGQELMTAMGKFNEELVKAGIMQSGDGLKPSSQGYRVRFSGSERTVTKGPFTETGELIAGYWLWTVNSMEEALEWAKKCPNPMEGEESDLEIRPLFEMDDFAEVEKSGEFAAHENDLRFELAMQKAQLNNYLFFSGRCAEALEFYKRNLGARLGMSIRWNQCPDPLPEGTLQEGFEHKVMHGEFSLGDTTFFVSDGCDEQGSFGNFSLSLRLPNEADVQRVFDALAKDGEVIMPLAPTFFSPFYGQVKDKFGMGWMVMVPGE